MKSYCILLAIVIYLIAVEGRNLHQRDAEIEKNENIDIKHLRSKLEKSTRKRRQSYNRNYNNYMNPSQNIGFDSLNDILFSVREIERYAKQGLFNRYQPNYYDRRDDSNKCEDSLKELVSLYKELVLHLKNTPPSPPQIIYVPYPIPTAFNYPVDKTKTPNLVNITNRNKPDDTNRIWMDSPKKTGTEDDGDGSRPVSFKPVKPKSSTIKPPPFEHGTSQAGVQTTTPQTIKKPGACEAAILSCCGLKTEQEQENCFSIYNCSKSYKTGLACSPDIIQMVLDNFSKMYGPINEF